MARKTIREELLVAVLGVMLLVMLGLLAGGLLVVAMYLVQLVDLILAAAGA